MKATIIGFKNVDFTPEGKDRIVGTSMYLALYNESNPNLVGGTARKVWRTPDQMDAFVKEAGILSYKEAVGRSCNAYFDDGGKLESIVILPPENLPTAMKQNKGGKSADDLPFGK